ncbi:MAG: acyloxyacyl hydrolase [Planctomycetes bacterium]|nr:acyloxyacyl hydrolase [Planctomycetota bacterium]
MKLKPTLPLVPLALMTFLTSCAAVETPRAPWREKGSAFVSAGAFHGVPILGRSLFWDGQGEVDDTGVELRAAKFVADDVAIGVSGRFASWWTPGDNVESGEIEGLLRTYPIPGFGLFLDVTGGYQLANHRIPPPGTTWNFSFSFGPGYDFRLSDTTRLQVGTIYHHISNALGRQNDRNPSQNELRAFVNFVWVL